MHTFHKIFTIVCIALAIHHTKSNDCIQSSSLVECSGRGTCQLVEASEYYPASGRCLCEKRQRPDEVITGRYCECDNFSCDRHDGKLCSGLENGYCYCGACMCAEWRAGPACECPTAMDACESPAADGSGTVICSGHGDCICGKCSCSEGFSGPYCLPMGNEDIFNNTLLDLVNKLLKN